MSNLEHIVAAQQDLLNGLLAAERGEIKVPDLKPLSGVLGILPQRNDLFATRIRITGGELPLEKFNFIAALVKRVKPGYIHFSSRQNIQLHDVPPGQAKVVIEECTRNGLPFRGGGGDSFRNVSASLTSGIAPDDSADLIAYARALTDAVFEWDEAFKLPRKLKIAFASRFDAALALRQDLGFVESADEKGNFGFTVYGGGGFGRNAAVGIELLKFIAPAELPRAARAMVQLFSEHGDRANRAAARIRYIRTRLGDREFVKLFRDYYKRFAKTEFPAVPVYPVSWNARRPVSPAVLPAEFVNDPGFRRWLKLAVKPTRFHGKYSVLLPVPQGVLSVDQFVKLAALLTAFDVPAVRLTIEQNVWLPTVGKRYLYPLYQALKKFPVDLTLATFRGQIKSCIGASVCKAGILDAPKYGALLADALDRHFRKYPAKLTPELALAIVTGVRLSGCHNSCLSHQAARIGLQGTRKKIGEELADGFTVWLNPDGAPIGSENPEFIPANRVAGRLIELLETL